MMSCEDIKAMLPEYWDGKLDEADRLILEAHVERCTDCRAEAEQLREVWTRLGELAGEIAPSAQVRTRFYDRLEAYRMGVAEQQQAPKANVVTMPARRHWIPAVAAAAALVAGFFGGYFVDARRDNGQISQLRGEVSNMRQLVALSLLQQQNASDRLQGVNWAYRVERSDTEVLSALLYAVNHDPNVNVRLAAVDAMKTFAESPTARRGLVQAIAKQESQMVQIALIDELVELKEAQARPALQGLVKNASVNGEVRDRAEWALGRLQ
jgi:anti-sigma factor RsiW